MQFKLLDADTGLIGDPEEWRKADSDEEAVETILALKDLVAKIEAVIRYHEAGFMMQMEAAGATIKELNGYELKLTTQRSYDYNFDRLRELYNHLPKERVEQALQPTFKVSKAELNKLVKLGGPVKEIIETAVIEVQKGSKLEIKRVLTPGR